MYLDKNAILNSLTKDDVTKVVTALGSGDPKIDSQGNLIFQTVCHGGTSYKLYYYHDGDENHKGRVFHCYTDCGDSFGIIDLVIRAKRAQGTSISWYKALYFIAQTTNKLIESTPEENAEDKEIIDDFDWINRLKKAKNHKTRAIPVLNSINENILDVFTYIPHEEFLNAGIDRQSMDRFEIGYYPDEDQITLPQRDIDGRLVGVRVRNLDFSENPDRPKYCPAVIEGKVLSHPTGSCLYGAWVTKDKIKECGKALLVEAEKSCLLAYTYFGEDSYCVAATGSAITLTQQRILLNQLKIRELIYAPDWDVKSLDCHSFEAEVWWNKQLEKVKPFIPFCEVYIIVDQERLLGYNDSPLDRGKDIFLRLYDSKIRITAEDYNNRV